MTAPDALRRAADVVEACAIGDRVDAIITLLASAAERAALGTFRKDEAEAIIALLSK